MDSSLITGRLMAQVAYTTVAQGEAGVFPPQNCGLSVAAGFVVAEDDVAIHLGQGADVGGSEVRWQGPTLIIPKTSVVVFEAVKASVPVPAVTRSRLLLSRYGLAKRQVVTGESTYRSHRIRVPVLPESSGRFFRLDPETIGPVKDYCVQYFFVTDTILSWGETEIYSEEDSNSAFVRFVGRDGGSKTIWGAEADRALGLYSANDRNPAYIVVEASTAVAWPTYHRLSHWDRCARSKDQQVFRFDKRTTPPGTTGLYVYEEVV